ncbi:Protein hit [Cupriavidus laharis]|uniref:Protein hit n=1 Tax=Cupriavidus laharis TaxID=151654 RepID=A0ABN7Z1N5_9BURK|nr:HIT family protein [Cupriavidus laharis]CAG9178165.1 Protein hit [Cupriavidus laharis]
MNSQYDTNNVFAKILRGEMPCIKVYEDDDTIAFMDIMPQSDGHTLVVPKEAAVNLFDLSEAGAQAAIRATQRVARAVRQAFRPDGISIGQFNGAAAGQTVPHVHFHIVPRYADQTLRGHARDMQDPDLLKGHAERIIAALREQAE